MTTNTKNEDLIQRFKAMTEIEKSNIIIGAVDAVMTKTKEAEAGQKAAQDATGGQLRALVLALVSYAIPMTEEVWDKIYRPIVADHLDSEMKNGAKRFNGAPSRDVQVNMIKVATMGITLARQDPSFMPSPYSSANLKKYAAEVRAKLQKIDDPETGQPRLRSIAKREHTKRLTGGRVYYLIGCEDAKKGLDSANTVIGGGDPDFGKFMKYVRQEKKKAANKKFKSFFYVDAKVEEIDMKEIREEEDEIKMPTQNTAVDYFAFDGSRG